MKISIYAVDDWAVIYKDGKAVYQGHSIEIGTLVEFVPEIEYSYNEGNAIDDYVFNTGEFPFNEEDLEDLKEVG